MFTCLHTSQIRWYFTNFFTREIRPDIEVLVRPCRVLLVVIHSSSWYSNLNWEYRIFTRDCGSIGFQQFIDIQNCVKKFFNFSLNFQQLLGCLEKWKSSSSFIRIITLKLLALVVRRLDCAIHLIKLYLLDSIIHPLRNWAFREKFLWYLTKNEFWTEGRGICSSVFYSETSFGSFFTKSECGEESLATN